jgi:hypothetical protein
MKEKEINTVAEFKDFVLKNSREAIIEKLKITPKRANQIISCRVDGKTKITGILHVPNHEARKFLAQRSAPIQPKKINDEEDDLYDLEEELERFKALQKNEELIEILDDVRSNCLGIGTNKLKRRLNKLAESSEIARAYRIALEIEDKNITAKKTPPKYKDKVYQQKHDLILELAELFGVEKWCFGKQNAKEFSTDHIMFFELPGCEQISWHCTLEKGNNFPGYSKPWDGKINSTLEKLLEGILKNFPEINKKS